MEKNNSRIRRPGLAIGVFCVPVLWLSFSGCAGNDDLRTRYEAEKLLYRAEHLKAQLYMKSPEFSDDDFRDLKDAYGAVPTSVPLPANRKEVESASPEIRQAWATALQAVTGIASLHMDRKEYDSAFVYYQKLIASPAVDGLRRNVVFRNLARVKERSGLYLDAAAYYDSVSTGYLELLDPSRPEMEAITAPISRAEMYRNKGDNSRFKKELENARTYYRRIIDTYPGSTAAEISSGKIVASHLLQGQYKSALNIMKSTGKDESGNLKPGVLLSIADIYLNNVKNYSSAEKNYREFLKLYPNHTDKPKAILGLGSSLYERGNFREARIAITEIDKIPDTPKQIAARAHILMALCYEREDKWQLALGQLEYTKAAYPGTEAAYEAALHIVAYYRAEGNKPAADREFDKAVAYIKKYLELSLANPGAAAKALSYLARAYDENSDIPAAAGLLERLYYGYRQTPDGLLASLTLADLYENALLDTAGAIKWLSIHIEDNTASPQTATLKARLEKLKRGR